MTPQQLNAFKATLCLAGLVFNNEEVEIIATLYEKVLQRGEELQLSEVVRTVASVRKKYKGNK